MVYVAFGCTMIVLIYDLLRIFDIYDSSVNILEFVVRFSNEGKLKN